MTNSPWKLVKDEPLPEGEAVLVYLAKPRLGSRYAIHSSRRGMDCWIRTINGLFDFDHSTPILAWRRMDDLERELPMGIDDGL